MKSASVRRDDDLDDDADVDDLDRDDDEPAIAAAAESAPVREGLPPTYRMRHEPHYVEALVAPPAAVAPVPPPVAPVAVAEPVEDVPVADGLAEVILALATSLESIDASLRDVSRRGRPLRDRVAIDLARAETARARWVADAAAVLQVDPLPSLDEVDLVAVCHGVAETFAPEYRVAGGAPSTTLPASPAHVFGDERLLTTAIGSVLSAVRALVEDRGDASRVTVALAPRVDTTTRTVEIAQSLVRVSPASYSRFFDATWAAHPAGPAGAVLLAAARRIAEAHGGALELSAVEGGGCRFLLSVPAAG